MSVKRYAYRYSSIDGELHRCEEPDGRYVLHSDYAAIEEERDKLAREVMRLVNINEQLHERHNALREAVEWERETDECGEWLHLAWWDNPEIDLLDIWDIHHAASAEVDRLLSEDF